MIEKKINSNGQKAYQREDIEDRTIVYKKWLRTIDTGGFFIDLDMVKFKNAGSQIVPCAITELTRCDYDTVNPAYLQGINKRIFERDIQGKLIQTVASILKVPAYLVLFHKNMEWLYVLSFQTKAWRKFTKEEWAKFVRRLGQNKLTSP